MTKKDNTVREKIIKGLEITHIELIQSKKDKNHNLVVSVNGKIIRLQPKDL